MSKYDWAIVLATCTIIGCTNLDVGVSIRDIDEDHLTECSINRHVASNKECMIEITFEHPL